MQTEMRWKEAKNILCIRLDRLGDVLMTSPAIRALKESRPGRKVTLLTSPHGAKAAALIPEIDCVIVYEAPWMKTTAKRRNSRADLLMAAKLKGAGFDAAVIFTVYSQSPLPPAFLCYLADIPLRLAHCRENPYQLLTDWVPDSGKYDHGRHEVRRQLDLVKTIGCTTKDERLSLHVSDDCERSLCNRMKTAGIDLDRPWIVIHPGASAASRRYPAESYAAAAQILVETLGLQVIFTGSSKEQQLVKSIQNGMTAASISLAGKLDLGELAALLRLSPLLISNNTGPVHMAAAVGAPVVDLYALTNPQHTPWMTPNRILFHDVPCKYCYKSVCPEGHHDCLRRVTPQSVVQAASELLAETIKVKSKTGL